MDKKNTADKAMKNVLLKDQELDQVTGGTIAPSGKKLDKKELLGNIGYAVYGGEPEHYSWQAAKNL